MTSPNEEVLARSIALAPAQRMVIIPIALMLAALVPFIGWAPMIPLALTLVMFATVKNETVQKRYGVGTSYAAWALGTVGVCAVGYLSDEPVYFMAPVMAVPTILATAIFPVRQIPAVAIVTTVAIALTCWASDPDLFRHDPTPVILPALLLGAITLMVGLTRRTEMDSFLESRVDPLTGAHNRLALDEHVASLPTSVLQKPWTLILADIDHFKRLNDRHGHAAGDQALRAVADHLRDHLPAGGRLYRFGGEEFLIAITDCGPAEARKHAERMRAGVATLEVGGPRITMSFGVATNPTADVGRFDALFARADESMYQAKQAGRNTIVVAPALPSPEDAATNGGDHRATGLSPGVGPGPDERSPLFQGWFEREHLVDVMTRQYRSSRIVDVVLVAAIAVFAGRIGYLTSLVAFLAIVVFRAMQANLHRVDRPELVFVTACITSQVLVAITITIGKGGNGPWGLFALAFVVVATSAAIPWRLMVWGFVISGLLIVATGLTIRSDVLTEIPQVVVGALCLLLACAVVVRELGRRIMAMRRAALHDRLTGLPNRNAFNRRLTDVLERTRRHGGFVSLVMADIDHFKQVNDNLGHSRGDAVLVTTASRLQSRLRHSSAVHRIGGEEFAILLPDVHEEVAAEIATRLRAAIAEGPVSGVALTMSFGVATSDGSIDAATLYKTADQALYRAKADGRNRVARASDTVEPRVALIPWRENESSR